MKIKLISILACMLISSINSQTTQVSNSVYFALDMIISNDILYASVSGSCITKVDLNNQIPQNCVVNEDATNFPRGLFLKGNDLYITGSGNGIISKIDISVETPQLTEVLKDLDNPKSIVIKDDILYIAEENEISFININLQNPVKSTFKSISVNGLNLYNNYIIAFNNTSILKIDINSLETTNLVDEISPLSIEIINDYLLFSENDKITKIDLSTENLEQITFLENVFNVRAIEYYNDELYIAEYDNNQVLKFDAETLSTKKGKLLTRNNIFPNPVKDIIYIEQDLQIGSLYSIIDVTGKTLIKGKTSYLNLNKINVTHLNTGLYFLKLENSSCSKFLKI